MKRNSLPLASVTAIAILMGSVMSVPLNASPEKKLDPKQPYALIFGTIFAADNHPARGIKIKIRREGGKKAVELVSDTNGEFAHRFAAGKADYDVWADVKDKQAAERTRVKVHIENDERQDITLHLTK